MIMIDVHLDYQIIIKYNLVHISESRLCGK